LTWIEMQGREVTFAIVDHLRTSLEGFANARVTTLPVRAGIRESRSWIGEAVLTEEDISRKPQRRPSRRQRDVAN
jgi:hypothetical protein